MKMAMWVVFMFCLPLCHSIGFQSIQVNSLQSVPNPIERLDALEELKSIVDGDVKLLYSDVTGMKTNLATCRETEKKYDALTVEKKSADEKVNELTLEAENLAKQLNTLGETRKQVESQVETLTLEHKELKSSLATCFKDDL